MSAAGTIRSFNLSESFVNEYKDTQPEWGYNGLGYVVYKRTYARMKPDGNLEEFWETCRRVVEGAYDVQKKHCKNLRLPWDDRKAQRSAQEMFKRMWAFKWLPPGRGLWMMGSPAIEKLGGAALNNCFSGDTEAVVFDDDHGLAAVPLRDLVGKEFSVPVGAGSAVTKATAKSFGEQELQHITLKVPGRSKYVLEYDATSNHRWILSDGTSTTALKLGDRVTVTPRKLDSALLSSANYERGFAHGLIYGDGTRHTYYPERHFIRLCGEKERVHVALLERLPEFLSSTRPASYGGDVVVTIKLNKGENWKQIPDSTKGVVYCRGFIDGWLAADGHTEPSGNKQLDSINLEGVEWLTKLAPTCGYCVTGWSVENADTNFGPRSKPLNRITLSTSPVDLVVQSIDSIGVQEVFCAVVPDANTFVLAGGLETGNCGFVSTAGIAVDFADPFCWLMDMLMLGVGVGFDTKGEGLVKVQQPTFIDATHVVEDSREGWVGLLRLVLNSYVGKHLLPIPDKIDYSKVRPAGTPIHGFGGVASGPEPLKELLSSIKAILDPLVDTNITGSAIVDICNLIGRCVVAGNVRRSAEIAFGDPNNEEFLNLKNPEINRDALYHHRWASNNSVFATVGMDYSRVAELTAKNGEPGYQWLDNARKFSRMKGTPDFSDMRVAGANPCVEQSLEDRELCCLVETFPGRHDTFEDYKKTLKFA
jgi:ribonucleotide reductase alpha subunit